MLPIFPELPIVTPDPPRKSQAEKYGGVYYLGIAGLVTVVGLVAWFGLGIGSLREVWGAIYRLHDARRPAAERIEAAYALSRDPRVSQRQRYDMVERQQGLPPLARYLLAESLTAEAAGADPRAYALAVAYSEGWPDWLRLLLLRPLAYSAGGGRAIPREPLAALGQRPDPILALWAAYIRAAAGPDAEAERVLTDRAHSTHPTSELAGLLRDALQARGPARVGLLDRATRWVRSNHPGAAAVWAGWREREGRLVREPAPELLHPSGGETPRTFDPPATAQGKERQR